MASEVFEFNVAAINAVIVVPMFAPIIKGAACFRLTIFFATIGTTTEVVTVLERIAAVVTRPQKKDFNGFLKKKRLNISGDLTSSRLEINLLKIRIEENNNTSEMTIRRKAFEIFFSKKSIIGANPYQKCEIVFSTGFSAGEKKELASHAEIEDRKP